MSKKRKLKGTILYAGIHMRAVETEEEICLIFNDHRTLEFFPKTAWQEVKQELAQLIKDVDRDTSDDCLIPQLETAPNL